MPDRSVTDSIAGGHAFDKHVLKKQEFPGLTSKKQFSDHLRNVVENADDVRVLQNDRKAFWHSDSGTVVIHDPSNPDMGTAFVPDNGKGYFDNLK